jgi:broad specificity phosphatase PhoE
VGPHRAGRVSAGAVRVLFVRHGEVPSHRGDLALTPAGERHARTVGEGLAGRLPEGERVAFLHAPTLRTRQTAEAIRAGMARALGGDARLEAPRLEHAIRNPDLYVAGRRVEMVSSPGALAAQLLGAPVTERDLERHPFFARFWAADDRIGIWLRDEDPPGERAGDVARRFFTFARSLADPAPAGPRRYVCVTHSGPLRALVTRCAGAADPGEPGYAEAVELELDAGAPPRWRFREP